MEIKGFIKEIYMNERGHREIKIDLLDSEEPDYRKIIKRQVIIKVEDLI